MMKSRLLYAAAFVIFLATEVCIALFVHDDFVRPYIGDVLAVVTVYCGARIVFPQRIRLMSLAVLALAAAVELLQLTSLSEVFGEGSVIAVILGSTFDPIDLLCYAAGGVLTLLWDILFINRHRKEDHHV